MSIKVITTDTELLIKYNTKYFEITDIDNILERSGCYTLKKVFIFKERYKNINFDDFDEDTVVFKLGNLVDEYWRIDKEILDLKYDLLLSRDLPINDKTFIATRDISIFKKLDKYIDEQIIIGGGHEKAISIQDFNNFLKKFPTSTELDKYTAARIEQTLGDYFETMSEAEAHLTAFLNKKRKVRQEKDKRIKQKPILVELELNKFEYVYQEIIGMLGQSETFAKPLNS